MVGSEAFVCRMQVKACDAILYQAKSCLRRITSNSCTANPLAGLRICVESVGRTKRSAVPAVVFHLVLRPLIDAEMSRFMGWIGGTHTMRYHAYGHTSGLGHVYQHRYKSFPIQADEHFFVVCRCIERNGRRATLVDRAENWR